MSSSSTNETTTTTPLQVRMIPVPTDSDDEIVDGLSYHRCGDEYSTEGVVCGDARASCGRFAAFQAKFLGPISPERHPAVWMCLNAFCLSWSLSLGVHLTLLFIWYGNEVVASKATTTHYLVYSLLTTLVWVVEISLRAAFPGLETVLVVATPTESDEEDEEQQHQQQYQQPQVSRTFTAEESVVTIETIVQRRSKKHWTVIITELLLAVFFGIETVLDCWNHWHHRHGIEEEIESNDDAYYAYDSDDGTAHYSMLQQESDIWINVLAYAYMTYHTYHEYYKARTTRMDIHRSLSSTLLSHQQHQQRQQQHQHQQSPPQYPQQHFPIDTVQSTSPNATLRTTFTRSAMERSKNSMVQLAPSAPIINTSTTSGNESNQEPIGLPLHIPDEPLPIPSPLVPVVQQEPQPRRTNEIQCSAPPVQQNESRKEQEDNVAETVSSPSLQETPQEE